MERKIMNRNSLQTCREKFTIPYLPKLMGRAEENFVFCRAFSLKPILLRSYRVFECQLNWTQSLNAMHLHTPVKQNRKMSV